MSSPAIQRPGVLEFSILIALAAMWGNSFVLTKWGVTEVHPASLAMIRTLGGGVILLLAALVLSRPISRKLSDWVVMIASAILGNAIPFVLIGWGQAKVNAGLGAVLMGVMPLMTLVLAHFFSKGEALKLRSLIGVLLGLIGLVLLVGPSVLYDLGNEGVRQIAFLGAAFCYALNIILTRWVGHLDPIAFSAVIITGAGVLLMPFGIPPLLSDALLISTENWLYILILVLFPTALAAILLFILVRRVGVNFFSQVNYLVPISGVAWGWALANEVIEPELALALLFILGGIALSRRRAEPHNSVSSTPQGRQI